ncbi:helix-turn-helix domain-containing protein [Cupriavidus basilensis]|uniref:helix-turn-helix domain-containing protein n=1 Tax=Cupriavidus basilensis TaxID=68895 RepID=UPI0009E6538D|nr:helix-turn-helix domain-containing protein [Cupriavidus basilensis]
MNPLSHIPAELRAWDAFRDLFEGAGWRLVEPKSPENPEDVFLTSDRGHTYCAVLKLFNEGRADRLTAAFAQGLLEARLHAKEQRVRPAVLIWVNSTAPTLVDRLVSFHQQYGDGEPFALLSRDGTEYVDFPGLHRSKQRNTQLASHWASHSAPPRLVLSDLSQWMLKLLLAVDIKREGMIGVDATRYRTATDLANAAGVSKMTATRLVNALKEEGLIESRPFLTLVRRRKLAERWKAAYQTPSLAVTMKFLSPAPASDQIVKLLKKEHGILGMFAAASALGVGHVRGIPPTVWVPNLTVAEQWHQMRRAREGESPDLILQQPNFPQSLQRGSVLRDGIRVTDIFQTWLDVSAHPARGAEQAAELEHGILADVIGESA